jgi:hypothetical protein
MELVIRLTLTVWTPFSLETAFSTWETQAEQVMPVTSKEDFTKTPAFFFSSVLFLERL